MASSREGATCSVADGKHLSINLPNLRVPIPSNVLDRSTVLTDVLSSACTCDSSATKDFRLPVPTEWLESWLSCFVTKEETLGSADIDLLVNCLMVRAIAAPETNAADIRFIDCHAPAFFNP
jgi:hypothetical protein